MVAQILIAFGAFQAFFLALVLLASKQTRLYQKLFGFFLFIEGFTLAERVLVDSGFAEYIPHIIGSSYVINFVKPAILYFTGLSLINAEYRLSKRDLFHGIPSILILVTAIPVFTMPAIDKINMATNFSDYVPGYNEFNFWFFLSFFFYIGIYLLLTIQKLRTFLQTTKKNEGARWFYRVMIGYSLGLGLGLIYYLIRPSGILIIPNFHLISMLLMTFLIQSIAYKFVTRSTLWQTPQSTLQKYDGQQVNDDLAVIKEKFEKQKIYRLDNITLDHLANELGMKKKYLSGVINQRWGQSFRDVVNEYRVEEAKARIISKNGKSLIQIGMESGFNNKVSFYRTFKRMTGYSPSEFQQRVKK